MVYRKIYNNLCYDSIPGWIVIFGNGGKVKTWPGLECGNRGHRQSLLLPVKNVPCIGHDIGNENDILELLELGFYLM